MRYIKTYRYRLIHKKADDSINIFLCSSHQDVKLKTGISRASLNLMLNNQYVNKFKDWGIERCDIKKTYLPQPTQPPQAPIQSLL
jgi:hypothetical protein